MFSCLAVAPVSAMGDSYKCIAPDGKVTYTGQASMSPDVKCEKMFVRKPPVTQEELQATEKPEMAPAAAQANAGAGQVAPKKTPADLDLEAKRQKATVDDEKKKASKAAEDKQAEQKVRTDNCRTAQANLRTYEFGGRISRVDEKGEKVYLNDSEIKQKTDEAMQEVNKWCDK